MFVLDKVVKIRKGQTINIAGGETVVALSVVIPVEHARTLGWKHGEKLIVECDIENNSLIYKKME